MPHPRRSPQRRPEPEQPPAERRLARPRLPVRAVVAHRPRPRLRTTEAGPEGQGQATTDRTEAPHPPRPASPRTPMSVFAELSPPYSTIVADPPWHYDARPVGGGLPGTMGKAQPFPYSTMSVDEVCALPVGDLASDDAV